MIISVCNEKGGSGKSTLAINLACKLMQENKETLVIDTDPQRSIEDFLAYRDENLELPFYSVSKFGVSLSKEIKNLRSKYENLILDTGGRDSREMRQAIILSNIVIIPIVPSGLDIAVFEKMINILKEAQALNENLKIFCVISKASPNPFLEKKVKDLKAYLKKKDLENFSLAHSILFEREAFRSAIFEGKGITEMENCKAKDEFERFYKELFDFAKSKSF